MVRAFFGLVRNLQTVFKCSYHFASPPATFESSCCSTSPSAFGVVSVLDFGHSIGKKCVEVSRSFFYCTSLIPYHIRTSFPMLICHLCIFFGEVSLKVFGSFLNRVFAVFLLVFKEFSAHFWHQRCLLQSVFSLSLIFHLILLTEHFAEHRCSIYWCPVYQLFLSWIMTLQSFVCK